MQMRGFLIEDWSLKSYYEKIDWKKISGREVLYGENELDTEQKAEKKAEPISKVPCKVVVSPAI